MRVLVCGDRNWQDNGAIEARLRTLPRNTTIIHGCARGADTLAGSAALRLGLSVRGFPAKWDEYGRAAGHIRNQQMLDEGRPELVIAFHSNIAKSRGTADMLRRAKSAGLPTELLA